jgi:hypothetical protein
LSIFKTLISFALAFAFTATVIMALCLLSAQADNAVVSASIRASLNAGTAVFPTSWDRNPKTGIDTWTDCLVLKIATYGEKDVVSALTRSNHLSERGADHPCYHLESNLGGSPSVPGFREVSDYWRYWWGSAALLNIALGIVGMSLPSYQAALKLITYIALALVACAALARYRRVALPFLPLGIALTFGFAIPLFGQSVAHAPGLIVGLLLLFGYMVAGVDRASPWWQFAYFFFVGGLGFYFDLLNGDLIAIMIAFALIRLLGTRAFGLPRLLLPASLVRFPATVAVVLMMLAYTAGAVSMALFRIMLRAVLTHQSLLATLSEWHAQISKYSTDKLAGSGLAQIHTDTVSGIFHRCYYDLEVATFPYIGRHATLIAYVLCGLAYVGICIWILRNRKKLEVAQLDNLLAAVLIASVVPLWYSAFAVHAIIHFWMMGRLLALFFSLSISIALIVFEHRSRARVP